MEQATCENPWAPTLFAGPSEVPLCCLRCHLGLGFRRFAAVCLVLVSTFSAADAQTTTTTVAPTTTAPSTTFSILAGNSASIQSVIVTGGLTTGIQWIHYGGRVFTGSGGSWDYFSADPIFGYDIGTTMQLTVKPNTITTAGTLLQCLVEDGSSRSFTVGFTSTGGLMASTTFPFFSQPMVAVSTGLVAYTETTLVVTFHPNNGDGLRIWQDGSLAAYQPGQTTPYMVQPAAGVMCYVGQTSSAYPQSNPTFSGNISNLWILNQEEVAPSSAALTISAIIAATAATSTSTSSTSTETSTSTPTPMPTSTSSPSVTSSSSASSFETSTSLPSGSSTASSFGTSTSLPSGSSAGSSFETSTSLFSGTPPTATLPPDTSTSSAAAVSAAVGTSSSSESTPPLAEASTTPRSSSTAWSASAPVTATSSGPYAVIRGAFNFQIYPLSATADPPEPSSLSVFVRVLVANLTGVLEEDVLSSNCARISRRRLSSTSVYFAYTGDYEILVQNATDALVSNVTAAIANAQGSLLVNVGSDLLLQLSIPGSFHMIRFPAPRVDIFNFSSGTGGGGGQGIPVGVVAGIAAGAGLLLITLGICLWRYCGRPTGGRVMLNIEEGTGKMQEVAWELRHGRSQSSRFPEGTSAHDVGEDHDVHIVWHVDLNSLEQLGLAARPQLELEGPMPLAAPHHHSGPGPKKSSDPFDAYGIGESVEYYSHTNHIWTAGTVVSSGHAVQDVIVYRVTVGLTQQLRTLVCLDILRRPLAMGELVSYHAHSGWVPAVVTAVPLTGHILRTYSIQATGTAHSQELDHVPAALLRRRFLAGIPVGVYMGPAQGWIRAVVLAETGARAAPVRDITSLKEIPDWPIVLVRTEDSQEIEVPSYRIHNKALSLNGQPALTLPTMPGLSPAGMNATDPSRRRPVAPAAGDVALEALTEVGDVSEGAC